ncbi:MAG: gliding motility lipoprotein GldH [Bacteroidetes bacterium]|nr:gliding motility lipoprotein GldH [Bacteroidota bacterium]
MKTPLFLISLLCVMLVSCDPSAVEKTYFKCDGNAWDNTVPTSASFTIEEDGNYAIFFALRHVEGFQYQELEIIAAIIDPEGEKTQDRFSLKVRADDGSYLGDGSGDIWDIEFPIFENLKIEKKGKYSIAIKHDMDRNPLPLVMEYGFVVRKK